MNNMLASILGAAALVAVPLVANAAPVETFDFTTGGSSGPEGTMSFTGDLGAPMTVHSFSRYEFFGTQTVKGDVTQTSNGLGVDYGFLDDGQLDDYYGEDYLVLELATPSWKPVSIDFSLFNPGFPAYDDYQIYGTNTLDVNSASGFFADLGGLTALVDSTTHALAEDPFVFDSSVASFKHIIIGAHTDNGLGGQDAFRVASFQGTVVPLPPALVLLGSALAGLGVVGSWRRRIRA